MVRGARVFLGEVAGETRKSTWPDRHELVESTAVVIVAVVLLAVFVGASDQILIWLLKLVFPSS
ncbi:MAG: preprotein translocase subunit SecE [Lentisphaerae bacterium]|nr:preprotein translocase subunit SecE [Lentisphaerota bacterium]